MKIKLSPLLLLFALLFQACVETQDEVIKTESVQFTFNAPADDANSGGKASGIPENSMVRVALDRNDGNPATTLEVRILNFGGGMITEPIALVPGRYSITEFMIVSESEVLFATPKKGSPLASAVSTPLAHSIVVGKDKVNNVPMDVIDTRSRQPEDFGYVSFHTKVVNPLQIAVFILKNGKMMLTTAEAQILQNGNVIDTHSLKAKTNVISFEGNVEETYTLVVKKEAYGTVRENFSYSELIARLDGSPWKINLVPALQMHIRAHLVEDDAFKFILEGAGTITLSGAGQFSGVYELPWEQTDFSLDGEFDIEITGDIQNITGISSFGYNSGIQTMSGLEHLTQLQHFSPGWYFNDDLDLRQNTLLETLDLMIVTLPSFVKLPEQHYLKTVSISQGHELNTTEEIDYVVDNIYQNTVTRNITNGYLSLRTNEPISESARNKILGLRNTYRWTVDVDNL